MAIGTNSPSPGNLFGPIATRATVPAPRSTAISRESVRANRHAGDRPGSPEYGQHFPYTRFCLYRQRLARSSMLFLYLDKLRFLPFVLTFCCYASALYHALATMSLFRTMSVVERFGYFCIVQIFLVTRRKR